MKYSDNDIYNYFIRLYDNSLYTSILNISDRRLQFQEMQKYACLAVERWKDCFELCDNYPLLRLETNQIAIHKATYFSLVSVARNENELRARLLEYFKKLAQLVEKADKEFQHIEDKSDGDIEWLDEADDFKTFMKGFQSRYSAGSTMYLSAEKSYAEEEINDWYSEIKEDLTDSEAKEEYGAINARKLLNKARKIKETYISLVRSACAESDFEKAVFDFTTYSAELEYQLDSDDNDEDDEEEKEERREERREKAAEVAGVVAAGAGTAAKTTGKSIWKIIFFPFWLIWQLLKFLFGTKGGRILLVFIILAAAGVTVWLTKAYVPVVNWVTGLFKNDDSNNNDNPTIETPPEKTDFIFELQTDDTYAIKKYNGNDSSVIIPKVYNNKLVTNIGVLAFEDCKSITTLTISENITAIESSAFANCSSLETVNWNATNCEKAGEYDTTQTSYYTIFFGCTNLKNIIISESVKTIPAHAFRGCSGITEINVPNSITSIGDSAFRWCSGLTKIVIPESVTSIGYGAFNGCSALISMSIPFVGGREYVAGYSNAYSFGYIFGEDSYTGGISTIQAYSSTGGARYYIPASLTTVTVARGELAYCAFENCVNIKHIELTDTTAIGESAFYKCVSLQNLVLSKSLETVDNNWLSYCDKLQYVYYKGSAKDWNDISFWGNNDSLGNATLCYYSETRPSSSGNYWYYDESGKIKVW